MPANRTVMIRVRVTPEENVRIRELARISRLSMSELLRRLVMAYPVPDQTDLKRTDALLRVNRNLASLGNLLRKALFEPGSKPASMSPLLDRIDDTHTKLRPIIGMMVTEYKRKRR